jgi:hypothetical protein
MIRTLLRKIAANQAAHPERPLFTPPAPADRAQPYPGPSVRYLPKLIAEIFAGPYYATISPDGTVAVTIRMGKRGGWLELRRR